MENRKADSKLIIAKHSLHNKFELLIILCLTIALASFGSHIIAKWLKIKTSIGMSHNYGTVGKVFTTRLYGSSTSYSWIDWLKVSEALCNPIESWGSFGSTPSEWEYQPKLSNGIKRIFIVVCPSDLNEYALSDFRANYVPLRQTIQDLKDVKTDWQFSKKVLSQYPIKYVRILFPTIGRSDGVFSGTRNRIKCLIKRGGIKESMEDFNFEHGIKDPIDATNEKLSDWSPGRLQRRTSLMKASTEGKYSFNGLKKMALNRIIEEVQHIAPITLVVVSESPFYQKEILTDAGVQAFEMEIADIQHSWPQMKVIRLDQLVYFNDDAMFSDFSHVNIIGQKIATTAFLKQLQNP